MSWNDDSWRDGYDAWKLASPYDDEDPCDEDPRAIVDAMAALAEAVSKMRSAGHEAAMVNTDLGSGYARLELKTRYEPVAQKPNDV